MIFWKTATAFGYCFLHFYLLIFGTILVVYCTTLSFFCFFFFLEYPRRVVCSYCAHLAFWFSKNNGMLGLDGDFGVPPVSRSREMRRTRPV